MSGDKAIQVAVIGAGPGGYAAAFLASDLGMQVTLIDPDINPGGVCLFRGCIPSKALLHAAKVLAETKEAKNFGIEFSPPKIDLNKLRAWKDSVVERLTSGVGQLCKLRKVKFITGRATFLDSQTLLVKMTKGGEEKMKFDKIILATGSFPIMLPNLPKSKLIMDSTSALEIESIPSTLLVVGGGYIGLELGTVYHELGSKVSVVEMTESLLLGADRDLANILIKGVEKKFASVMVKTKVVRIEEAGKNLSVTFQGPDGKESKQSYDKILISIGRKPNTANLGLENTSVQLDQRGFVKVNLQRQTNDPNIYAIGDIAGEPMLAHKASHEGRVAAEAIAGHKVAFEPNAIPAVVFTDPELAWCGITETEALKQNRKVEVVKFPWGASGRAITLDRTDGLTKMIIDADTQHVLGVGIVGVGAGELIAEGVLAIEMGALASDVKLSIHPHPTLSETFMESAEVLFGQSTHVYKPKK